MKIHLVSGGCGFVGRNVVKRILTTTEDKVFVVDDLSTGLHPSHWLQNAVSHKNKDLEVMEGERLFFWRGDFRIFLRNLLSNPDYLIKNYGLSVKKFSDVHHFAAIVGGRAKIEGDPMAVAIDLAIDAEFFYWVCQHKPERVLYPSSSAAYPVNLQSETQSVALAEKAIDFEANALGKPDMTYGWSKLTGEYLAKIAAEHYGLSVTCIRPFSGYGEDQDLSYPIPAIAARAARRENPFEVWGDGKQGRDFVHIDDCLDCMFLAMDEITDGSAINIGAGKLTTFLEIIELFCKFANYKPEIKPLLDKPVGVHSRYADMNYVADRLGWKPRISLESGLRRVYDKALEPKS
ncbi:NAD-dependent epimerase/dehydratase family protein [candidate division KSB1 bacterium]|nr:NAD-dependent epimerase/dehydratase family protein [candidate division KSB1 bacterium]